MEQPTELDVISKVISDYPIERIKSIIDLAQSTPQTKALWDSKTIIEKVQVVRDTLNPKPVIEPPEEVAKPTKGDKKERQLGMGDSNKSLGITILVGVVAVVASLLIGGMQNVSKADFTANIKGLSETVATSVKAVNDVKAYMDAQIATIPGTVSSQTSGLTSRIDQLNTTVTSLSNDLAEKITTATNTQGGLRTDIDKTQTDVTALLAANDKNNTGIADLFGNVTALGSHINSNSADIASLQSSITSLQSQINVLKVQYANSSISIISGNSTANLTNGIAAPVSVTIQNTGATQVTFTLTLTLTSTTSAVSSIGASISTPFTSSVTGTTVTFSRGITIDANSSVTLNPNVTLTYAGTSPNIWNVVWSKN